MAGLFSALALRKVGWKVDVFERSGDELASRGAGVSTQPELTDALAAVGIPIGDQVGVPVTGRVTYALDGSVAATLDRPQIMTSWDRLYRLLRAPLGNEDHHAGMYLVGVESAPDRVTAVFDNGRTEHGDLLIGADGVRSTVRKRFHPEAVARYAGYVAWRGLVDENALSLSAHEALSTKMSFCLPASEQILTYPVSGENDALDPGRRRMNWVWYRGAREGPELEALLTDRDGKRLDIAMPPNRIDEQVVALMRTAAHERLPPYFQELIDNTEQPFLQAIYDLESDRIVFGRCILVGDSAFVARPHTGMGVAKAGCDAVALADALAASPGDIDAGLAQYNEERTRFGKAAVAQGRGLGALFNPDADPDSAGIYATGGAVDSLMGQVALSDWVDSARA